MKQLPFKVIFVAIVIITIALVMSAGCTSTSEKTVVLDTYAAGSTNIPAANIVQQINNNTYYVNCDSTNDCALKVSDFEATHNMVAFAPCDNGGYGRTSGYFFITK
jgi:hypothetical protein